MGKIYYIMGKSSSGKDTLFQENQARAADASDSDALHDQTEAGR